MVCYLYIDVYITKLKNVSNVKIIEVLTLD